MTTFVCWLWQGHGHIRSDQMRYGPQHVNVLASMLRRHGGHRLVCVTPDPSGIDTDVIPMPPEVARLPTFYPKLWAFSEAFGDQIGERFASIDLDCVILGDLGSLVEREGEFIVWDEARGEFYNTSFFVLEPSTRAQVWGQFSVKAAVAARGNWQYRWCGDQSWVAYVLGSEEQTFKSAEDGLRVYRPSLHRDAPEPDAMAMFMCGPFSPDTEAVYSAWVREAWR